MANDFFTKSGSPITGAALQSAPIRTEIANIEAGFDKMPALTGNPGEIVAVNSGATALEAITTTGTGSGVRATSPTLVTPTIGVATATSINKVTITQPATSATVTVADGKVLTASNTLTLTATDGATLAIGTGGTLGTAAYIAASTKQDVDATLTSIALLGTAADKLAYTTGVDAWAETGLTAFARTILDDANEATFKATVNLEIGTDVQAYDADLTTWAGVTPGTGVATALAVAVGSAGALVANGGALGTPSSGTLDNCTSNTEAANNNSTQLATTAYADRLTAGTLPGAFTTLSSANLAVTSAAAGILDIAVTHTGTGTNDSTRMFVDCGSSSGTNQDAYFLARTNNVLWSAGIDHSDADSWKLDLGAAPGSGTKLRVDTNGLAVTGTISGTSIQNTPIGSTTASTGAFTTLRASGDLEASVTSSYSRIGFKTSYNNANARNWALITNDQEFGDFNFRISNTQGGDPYAGTVICTLSSTGLAVTGTISATTTIKTGGYTVGTLPAGVTGDRAYVTDATAPTYLGALTGGGAVVCPVFKNASAWVSA